MYKNLTKKPKDAWQESEDKLQFKCAEFLKKLLKKHDIPQNLFWHIPSEGKRKPQYIMKLKAMGFKTGIPDIVLQLPSQEYHSLQCELKKARNYPSTDQKQMLTDLEAAGHLAVLINDFETFKDVVTYYVEHSK